MRIITFAKMAFSLNILIGLISTGCRTRYVPTYIEPPRLYPGTEVRLVDSITHNYYILDSAHKIITAYDPQGRQLWRTDPRTEGQLEYYRHKDPWIDYFKIMYHRPKTKVMPEIEEKHIYIGYSNTQSGNINMDTGEFHFIGQD